MERQYYFKNGIHLITQTFYDGHWWWLVLDKGDKLLQGFRNYDHAVDYARNYKN